MNNFRSTLIKGLLSSIVLLIALPAHAVPIVYEGTLSPGVTDGGFINDPALTGSPHDDFWSFFLESDAHVTVTVNRLISALDPAYTLYRGVGNDTNLLTNLGGADDNIAELPGFAGPFSDPHRGWSLSAGSYTVQVWDFASSAQFDGGSCYQITLNRQPTQQEFDCGRQPVPEPGTLAMFGLGLFGMGLARRRRTI